MEIKDQLAVRMKQLDVSVNTLARDVGVSSQSVRHWLNGRSYPGKRHVSEIEKRLSMKLDFSSDAHRDLPTLGSSVQAKDIEMLLKYAQLPADVKMVLNGLVDTLLFHITMPVVHAEEAQGPAPASRHSPQRAPRQAAAR